MTNEVSGVDPRIFSVLQMYVPPSPRVTLLIVSRGSTHHFSSVFRKTTNCFGSCDTGKWLTSGSTGDGDVLVFFSHQSIGWLES